MKKLFIFIAVISFAFMAKAQEMPEYMLKLMYTSNMISRFYVDEADNNKITEAGIKAMLKELDPHSTYSNPKETKALLEQFQRNRHTVQHCFGHTLCHTDNKERTFRTYGIACR